MKKSISSINNIENFVFNTVSTEYNKLIENFVKTLQKNTLRNLSLFSNINLNSEIYFIINSKINQMVNYKIKESLSFNKLNDPNSMFIKTKTNIKAAEHNYINLYSPNISDIPYIDEDMNEIVNDFANIHGNLDAIVHVDSDYDEIYNNSLSNHNQTQDDEPINIPVVEEKRKNKFLKFFGIKKFKFDWLFKKRTSREN